MDRGMNLFDLAGLELGGEKEHFQPLAPDRGVLIERIVSSGQGTPPGEWYDQPRDEWVALLQGEAVLEDEAGRRLELKAGDTVLIPARVRHRVAMTSHTPPAIWLAVHGALR